ncbi:MAG: YqgE/AlgH family protein [Rhodospirillaceae bacterium]|nr:MAG: YqgE/AlgH family protein [Rhodospirillaceae bacterium]
MTRGLLHQGFMTGQLLVAMPQMRDARFSRTVIYVCAHTGDGAMGLVINRLVGSLTFPDLLEQLGIDGLVDGDHIRIRSGGPVETGRGFVLHSADYQEDATLQVGEHVGLTATIDILRDIAAGSGPRRRLLALGYAGWGPGQLDAEIQANAWLCVPADDDLIFDDQLTDKWERSIGKLGVDYKLLSSDAGRA